MITWVQVLLAILSLAREIVRIIGDEKKGRDKLDEVKTFKDALKKARISGDTTDVEAMFTRALRR